MYLDLALYSKDYAKKYSIEEAILFHWILTNNKTLTNVDLFNDTGISVRKQIECFEKLKERKHIFLEDGIWKAVIPIDMLGDVSQKNKLYTLFPSQSYVIAVTKYVRFLESKGRFTDKTEEYLFDTFKNKKENDVVNALMLSVNNNWVTLYFNEDSKREDKGTRTSGGTGIVGKIGDKASDSSTERFFRKKDS